MKAFVTAVVLACAIAGTAWAVLGNVDMSARTVYSTSSVRF